MMKTPIFPLRFRRSCSTGSGWCCVWDRDAFRNVAGYETWEAELLMDEDIRRHLRAGNLVPINGFSDGVYDTEVRIGSHQVTAVLTDEERAMVTRTSGTYRFTSAGHLCMSGVEFVQCPVPVDIPTLEIPSGQYAAVVHDTGRLEDLANFIVLINPRTDDTVDFSEDHDTFGEQTIPATGHLALLIRETSDWRETGRLISATMGQDIIAVRHYLKNKEPVYLGPIDKETCQERVLLLDSLLRDLHSRGTKTEIHLDGRPVTRERLQAFISENPVDNG